MILRLLVAAVVLLLALDGGTYSLVSRHSLAIAVWWTVLVGLALGFWPRQHLAKGTLAVGGLLTAFVGWTALSIGWAASAEKAFLELDRAALFLGVFVLAALAAQREDAPAWCDGLAIGLVGVTCAALGSRFFPEVIGDPDLVRFLPDARGRLTYPVDYWNGLGILLALAVPLLLRAAAASRSTLVRGVALAPLPAIAAAIYLTSSRGGTAVALLGAATFVALTSDRWAAAAAFGVAALGSIAAVGVLESRPDLANAVGDAPTEQGPTAALLIASTCVAGGVLYALGARFVAVRPPRALGWAAVAGVAALAIAGVIAADPAQRLEEFKQTPAEATLPREEFVTAHILSGGGSGRWQFWSAAADEFREHPLRGGGAGSYEAWWAQHGSFAYFIRDAHSLYLETLAELGLVGFALLVSAFAAGLFAAWVALSRAGPQRPTIAALTATFLAYVFGAGIDWMWELTVVSVVGFACLGLMTSAAAARAAPSRNRPLATAGAVIALLVITVEALPLLTQMELNRSQAEIRRGDAAAALAAADTARRLQPWAASPHVQLALVREQTGELPAAREAIVDALERDRSDWRSWLIAARIETKAGDVAAARRSLARAIELNPRSPLFRSFHR